MARKLAPKLSAIFWHLVKGGGVASASWRLTDIVPVSKECPSSDVGGYIPISITPLICQRLKLVRVEDL